MVENSEKILKITFIEGVSSNPIEPDLFLLAIHTFRGGRPKIRFRFLITSEWLKISQKQNQIDTTKTKDPIELRKPEKNPLKRGE